MLRTLVSPLCVAASLGLLSVMFPDPVWSQDGFRLVRIAGPGTATGTDISNIGATGSSTSNDINDIGTVVTRNRDVDNIFVLGTGDTLIDVRNSVGTSLSDRITALSIDNANVITFVGTDLSTRDSRVFETSPPYDTFSEVADIPETDENDSNTTNPAAFETNSSGQGVLTYTDAGSFLARFSNGNFTILDQGNQIAKARGYRARILENGDIYSVEFDFGTGMRLLRWPSGSAVPETVFNTMSRPNSGGQFFAFDANRAGDWAVALNESGEPIVLISEGGNLRTVELDADAGTPTALMFPEFDGPIVLQQLGSTDLRLFRGEPPMPVIATGDSFDGITVGLNIGNIVSNARGQAIISLTDSLAIRYMYRLDPRGYITIPELPEAPNVCLLGQCWRFPCEVVGLPNTCRVIIIDAGPGRPCPDCVYYDPEPAVGYVYRAQDNKFTVVEVPFEYGDGVFDLFRLDDSTNALVDTGLDFSHREAVDLRTVLGAPDGVEAFAIFGIEPEAEVDPTDPEGFVTGLLFAEKDTGAFFMWPVTETEPILPVADAGDDDMIDEGEFFTLDGSGSVDPLGRDLSFQWIQKAGPPVILFDDDTTSPSFFAPPVDTNQTLTFELVVDNGEAMSPPNTVDVVVKVGNSPPVSDAGDDFSIREGLTANLDGSSSFDPDGDDLVGFDWLQTGGPDVDLNNSDTVSPFFSAPVGIGSILRFQLQVSDGQKVSVLSDGSTSAASDAVEVTVVQNSAPTADAGPDQTVEEGTTVSLDGSDSSDIDGDGLIFSWAQISGPIVDLDDDMAIAPTFVAPEVQAAGAELVFELQVTDNFVGNPLPSPTSGSVKVNVLDVAAPPACDIARVVPEMIWPPNHKMVPISIEGVAAEEEDIIITLLNITQDEPVNGEDDGDTSPDAAIGNQGGSETALLRAERSGIGDGRVYEVNFSANNGDVECLGTIQVPVPPSRKGEAIDSGQVFDAMRP